MQRLVQAADIAGSQSGRHRLDALAPARQQQHRAIGLQRLNPVGMPHGRRQAVEVCRKALLLRAWPRSLGAHNKNSMSCFITQ